MWGELMVACLIALAITCRWLFMVRVRVLECFWLLFFNAAVAAAAIDEFRETMHLLIQETMHLLLRVLIRECCTTTRG